MCEVNRGSYCWVHGEKNISEIDLFTEKHLQHSGFCELLQDTVTAYHNAKQNWTACTES